MVMVWINDSSLTDLQFARHLIQHELTLHSLHPAQSQDGLGSSSQATALKHQPLCLTETHMVLTVKSVYAVVDSKQKLRNKMLHGIGEKLCCLLSLLLHIRILPNNAGKNNIIHTRTFRKFSTHLSTCSGSTQY